MTNAQKWALKNTFPANFVQTRQKTPQALHTKYKEIGRVYLFLHYLTLLMRMKMFYPITHDR